MPRIARDAHVVENVKNSILDAALSILIDEGYANLSMRKIGKKVGMTAANIYNYYSNKDELYLDILIQGFEKLNGVLEDASKTSDDILVKARTMIQAFVDFSLNNKNYYEIMFNRPTPKYQDYVGTEMEKVAHEEKIIGMRPLELISREIEKFSQNGFPIKGENIKIAGIMLWSQIHGILTLYNNNILIEVDDNPLQVIDRIIDLSVQEIAQFMEKKKISD